MPTAFDPLKASAAIKALDERFPKMDYVSFEGDEVVLDGFFRAEELRAILEILEGGNT
jgi:hypothetical protein